MLDFRCLVVKKRIIIKYIIALTLLTASLPAMAGAVVVRANLDSATLLMGRITRLHIEVAQEKGTVGQFTFENKDTLIGEVEIAAKLDPDTTDLKNNREQIKRDLVLQAFDSGLYVLPPVTYIVGADTFRSSTPLSLKVLPVNVDSLDNVHPIKPVAEPEYKWYDWLPATLVKYWWVLVTAIILLGAILAIIYLKKKNGSIIPKRVKKRLPPAEEAIAALQVIKSRMAMMDGKQYYTELTDVLRVYIDRRFGINAVEMTSSQIKRHLKERGETRAVDEQLDMILEIADFVKFAGLHPLPGDNEAAWQRAVDFVEATRPKPEPTVGGKEDASKS